VLLAEQHPQRARGRTAALLTWRGRPTGDRWRPAGGRRLHRHPVRLVSLATGPGPPWLAASCWRHHRLAAVVQRRSAGGR
jgi:hypothetical protein